MGLLIAIDALAATMLVSAALSWLLDRLWPDKAPAPLAFVAGLFLPVLLCVLSILTYQAPQLGRDGDLAPIYILGPILAVFLMAFTVPAAMISIGWLRRPPSGDAPPR
jgi:hypothetical protein